MKKVILRLCCGTGMESAEAFLVTQEDWDTHTNYNTSVRDDTLGNYAWESAVDFASSYGIYPMTDMPDDHDENEEDWNSDSYSEDIEGWFEEYDPEKHDGLMVNQMMVNQKEWQWRNL